MKIHPLVFITATALLSGCAGYNTAMFTAKSNAGLDLDMKPPTAEINISRKEAVIEPAFEKGKTPPVMASFKPRTGFDGSFKNYFLGVNQTFSGGDAAKTMALLYNTATPVVVPDPSIYDSTLNLDAPITNSIYGLNSLFTPAPPGVIRPFIFGTDTSMGLKVAWSGAGGQFPDTVKLGFNRKEFAWAPVSMSGDSKAVKMPSFLATIESNNGGHADTNSVAGTNGMNQAGGIGAIQYFATGEAASLLARQKDVRDAMLKRLDPTYASGGPAFGKGIVARQMLTAMEDAFNQLGTSDPKDPIAEVFYQRLQNIKGVQLPASFEGSTPPMAYYAKNSAAGVTNVFKELTTLAIHNPNNSTGLDDITAYMANLESSLSVIKTIKAQLAGSTNGVFLIVDGSTNQVPVTQTASMELGEQFQIQTGEYNRIQKQLAADKDVSAAFDYFKNLTKP